LIWASPALPGARHDAGAARQHGLPDALAGVGVTAFADTAYCGLGPAIRPPHRRSRYDRGSRKFTHRALSAGQKTVNRAHLYAHTTYLDALLLGMVQRTSVERMILESAAAFDAANMQRHLERLEQRAARFRTIYWLRDASTHGHANNILDAYHAQHELPERFAAVQSEVADLARTLQARDSERIGAALGVLTIVGLPFGAALETLQALGASSVRDLAIALGIALTVTGTLLTTRLGRLLVRQIRELK